MKDMRICSFYGESININSPKAKKRLFEDDSRNTINMINFYELYNDAEEVDIVWAKAYRPYYSDF